MKSAVEVFGRWAQLGKDEGMERGHRAAVDHMLAYALEHLPGSFSALDAGCGNGWVVRLLQQESRCVAAQGVDGAAEMIAKAKALDPHGTYAHADLLQWEPDAPVDLVHSMEVLYYFEQPGRVLERVVRWLKPGGRLIVGIDHYQENAASLSWPEDAGIKMNTLSEAAWLEHFRGAGLEEVQAWHFARREDWEGTLVLTGIRARSSAPA
jgi:trans-aconitate methyltransferase